MRKMLIRLFLFLIILVFIIAYFRYFERKSIYFPMRSMELSPKDIGLEYEDVYFKAGDGIKLNGWLIPKVDSSVCLLFCHGNAGNISHRLEIIDIFNKIGLNVFIFDYRGYGKSQGSPNEAGIYLDVHAAYDYLISKGIKKENIVIFGESLGAAAAVDLAVGLDKGSLVTFGLFTSAPDVAGQIYPFLPIKYIISTRYDNIGKIKNIKIPKLIIHSRDDEIIPYRHGERLFEAASEPKEFFKMRGGHNDAVLLHRDEFNQAIKDFLKRYRII